MEKGKLGNAIRKARIEKNISQEALAEIVGITPTHLKHIESEHRKPSIEVLFKLAETLNISLDSILFESESENEALNKKISLLLNKCSQKQLKIVQALLEAMLEE